MQKRVWIQNVMAHRLRNTALDHCLYNIQEMFPDMKFVAWLRDTQEMCVYLAVDYAEMLLMCRSEYDLVYIAIRVPLSV
jgi:hypothetical protein